MGKKLYAITIRGKTKMWSFNTWIDEKYLDEWRKDGIEINRKINSVPEWVVNIGFKKVWIFLQDIGLIPVE